MERELGLPPFRQRIPWLGGDLQTLRDTLRTVGVRQERGRSIVIDVPPLASGAAEAGQLLALLDQPASTPRGLVLLLHGLGGSSAREGLRRMGAALCEAGFSVLRLNLRGADPGRHLAGGTYAACCNSDLLPVIALARALADGRPLLGAGISLGGTMLLNACLSDATVLDGLFCASSPLDLAACSVSIERPRNRLYQHWLLKRLVRQTAADPFGLSESEERSLCGEAPPTTIRAFDAAITAPRWGYADVEDYYRNASPLPHLCSGLPESWPPTLMLQALDDPWVPAAAALQLEQSQAAEGPLRFVFTRHGGHNGFHGRNGCWGDQLAVAWLQRIGVR